MTRASAAQNVQFGPGHPAELPHPITFNKADIVWSPRYSASLYVFGLAAHLRR